MLGFFLTIFQNFKNWVNKAKLEKCQNVFSVEYSAPIQEIVALKYNLAKILRHLVLIFKKIVIIFTSNLLKNTAQCGNINA